MSRTVAAIWTGLGAALGLGVGIAGARVATMGMDSSSEARANYVLLGAVLGAAAGGATASAITTPKLLPA